MDAVPPLTVDTVVDLVNEYSAATRAAADEASHGYPVLPALGDLGSDTDRCRRAADALHAVFADGRGPVPVVNDLLVATGVRPRLDECGATTWVVPDRRRILLAAGTVSLTTWIAAHGPDRLGTCEAHRCADVFVDTSRAATRRYCSQTCLDRARVARWRSRQAASRDQGRSGTAAR
ncbi:MAG: CGNR zinc finger domain-containing protein [Acidimicrobiales bacterium]|nr:CGNR zinc finger domain-containing protein [Acidimicrobiales bacterium]